MPELKKYVSFNSDFKDSVNLYLDLNKAEKINSYIPTKSSIAVLKTYLESIIDNKMQSTLLIGPYGKGKSHLLLLTLAIVSLDRRSKENEKIILDLAERVGKIDTEAKSLIEKVWSKGKFLPILIMSTQGDLNQAFMVGLNDALKREGLSDIAPNTYYTCALETIELWKTKYEETYKNYLSLLSESKMSEKKIVTGLKTCEKASLEVFKSIYPKLTSGSIFNPLVNSEVLPMYNAVNDTLVDAYGYSGMFIIFDEFSKYIESQDKKSAGSNMKLLQDVCELANASKHSQLFFTMVAHKSVKEYGKYLSVDIINQFTGIEGRIKEIYFITSSKNNYELVQNAIFKTEDFDKVDCIKKRFSKEAIEGFYKLGLFSTEFTREDFENLIVKGCYPLSPTSAYLLLNVSEKVAQNERTLFTFISKDEPYSVARHVNSCVDYSGANWAVGADLIYDYFKTLFKKDITNAFIHNVWLQAEYAISHAKDEDQAKMLKTLAVITIVNKPEEMPADRNTLIYASEIKDPAKAIEELVQADLIYKKASNNSYAFKTKASSELRTEIKKRKDLKAGRTNCNAILSIASDVHYVLPKKYNDEYKMTRYFRYEFMKVEEFLSLKHLGVVLNDGRLNDGKFIVLYSEAESDDSEQIKVRLEQELIDNLVVVYSTKPFTIIDTVVEYDVIQDIKRDVTFFKNDENKVLEKELPIIEEELEKVISDFLDLTYGAGSEKKIFFIEDKKVKETNQMSLGDVADIICARVFSESVKVNNELINKDTISTAPIKKVRKTLIEQLLAKENMDAYLSGTSAEATIYRAIFVGTGLTTKPERNVENAVKTINKYVDSASKGKKSLEGLLKKLTEAPIGMRKGIIPIYLAYVISKRNEDIVVYFNEKEVQINSEIVLNMCEHPEEYSLFISPESVKKESYLQKLTEIFDIKEGNHKAESRIYAILASMQRWYRAQPQISKNLKKNNPYWNNERIGNAYPIFKECMQNLEANSYEVLFVTLPGAFECIDDFENLANLIAEMKDNIAKYYQWMIDKTVDATLEIFDSSKKKDLPHALSEWYEEQSELAKHGLQSTRMTNLMSCIAENKSFDPGDAVKRVVRAVTDMYMDSWNELSFEQYLTALKEVKNEIEALKNENTKNVDQHRLSFINKNGEEQTCYYSNVDENTGTIFRNIISDTLEDFSDLSTNDKVAILLEMISKELGK